MPEVGHSCLSVVEATVLVVDQGVDGYIRQYFVPVEDIVGKESRCS